MQTSQDEIFIRESLERLKLEMITQTKKKKSTSLKGGKYGHSELARYQKYVWINNKATILSWSDAFEGTIIQGKPPDKRVPTPQHTLRSRIDARQSRRVDIIISGGNISSGLWSVCSLKPQHLLVLIIFHLIL